MDSDLIAAAVAARKNAYAPYSRFLVGAAVRDEHGRIHAGCNVENAAYPQGQCAEAGALAAMVLAGGRRCVAAAVAGGGEHLVTPCGGCRQKLSRIRLAEHAHPRLRRKRRSSAHLEPRRSAAVLLRALPPPGRRSVKEARAYLKDQLAGFAPEIAIVAGSSLGAVADAVSDPRAIPWAAVPGFPSPTVSGHAGSLIAGAVGANRVIVVNGRVHPYETGDAAVMRPIIETLSGLGVRTIILLNAAGSLDPAVGPGRLMLITDHINFSGLNPLIGETGDERFVPLTRAYDRELAEAIRRAATAEAIDLAEGTYIWFSGPSFETPAEIRMARMFGADAVGMSTVPEVILARRFGLRVAAISVITNLAAGLHGASPSHAETKREGARAAVDMTRLLLSLFDEPLHE